MNQKPVGSWGSYKTADGSYQIMSEGYYPVAEVYNRADAAIVEAAPGLLAACREAAAKFREYERMHRDKGKPEKAEANAEMAKTMESAITRSEEEK